LKALVQNLRIYFLSDLLAALIFKVILSQL
jgi:hypothetical protein